MDASINELYGIIRGKIIQIDAREDSGEARMDIEMVSGKCISIFITDKDLGKIEENLIYKFRSVRVTLMANTMRFYFVGLIKESN